MQSNPTISYYIVTVGWQNYRHVIVEFITESNIDFIQVMITSRTNKQSQTK